MGRRRWRSMKRHYYHPKIFSRSGITALWKWNYFFIYLGAMLLLLVVLPALIAGGRAEPLDKTTEQDGKTLLPLVNEELLTAQVFLMEQGEIVEMDLDVYTAGVVAAEMPASFHQEALKAQAVAARTYTLQKMLFSGGRGCASQPGADLCTNSKCCQAWDSGAAQAMALKRKAEFSGAGTEEVVIKEISMSTAALEGVGGVENISEQETEVHFYDRVITAVEETQGLVLSYGGEYIEAVYHSTCGGTTAAASEVWGQNFPYLQPVEDPYCSHSPYYRQEVRMELASFLATMGMSMGDQEAVPVLAGHEPVLEVIGQGASGRNTLLRLPPRQPERMLSGIEFRNLFGLPSTHFHWKTDEDAIIFYTRGFGHGAGLCQYGADGMARAGNTFQEILEYYYQGATVQQNKKNP